MENQGMLGTQEAVVGGTEGGLGPTGVPPTTAAAAGAGGSGSRAGSANGQQRPDPAVPENPYGGGSTPITMRAPCRKLIGSRSWGKSVLCSVAKASTLRTRSCGESSVTRRLSLVSCRKRRGRKPDPNAPLIAENQRLVRKNAKLMKKLRRTEAILDVQQLSEILGIELPPNDYVSEP
jgi:hypothetical protein